MDTTSRAQRYESVQALRFVAALLVVITHSMFYASERLDPGLEVWRGGTVGVDIFFVISGFVMMITTGSARPSPRAWRYFSMRRLTRIVPMYWIATTAKIMTLLVLPGVAINNALNPQHVALSYFFLPTRNESGLVEPVLGVGWTLTFEMFFYAVFALALFVRVNPYMFASVVMLGCTAAWYFRPDEWPAWMIYFDKIVLYFVIGMTIAKAVQSPRLRAHIPEALAFLVFLAVAVGGIDGFSWSRSAWFRTVVVALIVLAVVYADQWIGRRIPRVVLFFGDASYSLYLFHPLVAPVVPVALGVIGVRIGWVSVVGSIVASLIVAAAIYWWVERPITRASRRLPYAGKPVPTPSPPRTPRASATRSDI